MRIYFAFDTSLKPEGSDGDLCSIEDVVRDLDGHSFQGTFSVLPAAAAKKA